MAIAGQSTESISSLSEGWKHHFLTQIGKHFVLSCKGKNNFEALKRFYKGNFQIKTNLGTQSCDAKHVPAVGERREEGKEIAT